MVAAGSWHCSLAYTQGGAGSSGKFSFDQNCWDNVYTNFSAIVGGEVCTGHPLTCEGFYSQVVNRKICPVCPTDQELLLNSTVDNGCLCEYTGSGDFLPSLVTAAQTTLRVQFPRAVWHLCFLMKGWLCIPPLLAGGSGFPVKTTIGIVVGTLSLCLVLLVIYRRRRRTPFSPDPPSHSSEEKEDDELDGKVFPHVVLQLLHAPMSQGEHYVHNYNSWIHHGMVIYVSCIKLFPPRDLHSMEFHTNALTRSIEF